MSTYKETLHLPRTDFPMKANLTQREPEILEQWNTQDLYGQIQEASKDRPTFILHDGPPFANGDVHMGTALNKLLKDFIVKSRNMLGFHAPYVPGWDCHGLPIEFRVVKESKGLSPVEVRQKSESYARQYIEIQRTQFRRLGVFGDWDHPYLTLDPIYEAEIIRAFGKLVAQDLVYRSEKPVYWSTGAHTALAEAEIEYKEKESPAIHVAFDSVDDRLGAATSVVIWTTTPWTLPANLAVAVHPEFAYLEGNFEREGETRQLLIAEGLLEAFTEATGWKLQGEPLRKCKGRELEGATLRHPFLERSVPIVLGDFVTLETGTGCVHIAPGHGADDYLVGRRYDLGLLSPVDDRGCFTQECGVSEWVGQYVFKANPAVIERLKGEGKLLAEAVYQHSYPHCWRSKTPVIFRAVDQFFIRIDAIREKALAEIDRVRWIPHWGRNRIYGTVESRPDWCISRQRSWGVPLPVFYTPEGEPLLDPAVIEKVAQLVETEGSNVWFALDDTAMAEKVGLSAGHTRKNDTLDVWIDSGVSHQAVLRRHPALRYPADIYLEATDQHRGWFQSSLMMATAIEQCAPYETVITHGFVTDVDGKKISKSESGSYKKPTNAEHFYNKYGADLVRLWAASVNYTDDVPFGEEIFKGVSDVYRRMRNTIRILLANLGDFDPATQSLPREEWTLVDRWILHRLQEVVATCREAYEAYEFHRVYSTLNQFCSSDLSSLYVDITKDRMYCDAPDSRRRRSAQTAMHRVLDALIRLLAPITAFTAEEAWKHAGHPDSVHLQLLPEVEEACRDEETAAFAKELLDLRSVVAQAIEPARQSKLIGNALEAAVTLAVADADLLARLQSHEEELAEFFILSELQLVSGETTAAEVTLSSHRKCERCWRYRPEVGTFEDHPDLCGRCHEVVVEMVKA